MEKQNQSKHGQDQKNPKNSTTKPGMDQERHQGGYSSQKEEQETKHEQEQLHSKGKSRVSDGKSGKQSPDSRKGI